MHKLAPFAADLSRPLSAESRVEAWGGMPVEDGKTSCGGVNPVKGEILELRRLVEERFPSLERKRQGQLSTGVEAIDSLAGGGLWRGALSEIVGEGPSSGSQLFLISLLETLRRSSGYAALVDGSDCFDPLTAGEDVLENLLWVRCENTQEALQAVDILVRDKNFAVILLDLRWNSGRELRRIPLTAWYRLQRVAEQSETSLVVFSAEALAASAQLRLKLSGGFCLDSCEAERETLKSGLKIEVLRRRRLLAAVG